MPHHVTPLRPLLFVPLLTACVPTGTPVTDDAGAIEGAPALDAGDGAAEAPDDRDSAAAADAHVVEAAIDAGRDLCAARDCGGATPYCDPVVGRCEICLEDDHCTQPGTRCLAYTCAECVSDSDCGGSARPHCVSGACVRCEADADCPGSAPHCVANACVECRAGEPSDCAASPVGSLCVKGACGECGSHADCGNPTLARCDAWNKCVPCEQNVECASQAAAGGEPLGVCDAGACVECTGTQYDACRVGAAQFVCDSRLRSCADKAVATEAPCYECVSDAQCMPGLLCMHTKKGTADTGLYCLSKLAEMAGSSCLGDLTASEATWVSVDGVSEVVCRHPTWSCPEYWASFFD
jgi:hypothetical protein